MSHPHDEDWQVLLRLLPPDWEQLARSSGAVERLRAKAAGLAQVSDVALLRRLRAWLYGKLLSALLAEKLGRMGRNISPWGYPQFERGGEPLA